MTQDDIIKIPHPLLRQKSTRIGHIDQSTRKLAEDMIAASLDWENHREHETAVALAAVQIAQPYRLVIVRQDFDNREDRRFTVLVNPEIVKLEGIPEEDIEGCLSVESIYGAVSRHPKVKVKALNLDGQPVRLTATGFLARVLQHEIDHTQGLVFVDRITDPTKLYRLQQNGELQPAPPHGL